MSNRVLIGLPLYGSVAAHFFQQWLSFQARLATACKGQVAVITTNMAYVDHADTSILQSALKDKSWDYIALIESDNIIPDDWPNVIVNELDPDVHKIVGRWYFGRVQEDMRPICGYLHPNGDFDRLSFEQVQAFRAHRGLYRVGAGMEHVDDTASTFTVGLGCTAVHRSVFEQWTGEMPWFKSQASWNEEAQRVGYLGHDIHFCMQAAAQGFDIWLDTRKSAGHVGEFVSDEETYTATAMHMASKGGFTIPTPADLPEGIPTATSQEERDELVRLAKDKVVLEIGSRYGASTIGMAQVARVVYALDWHRGDVWHGGEAGGESLGLFWGYISKYGLKDKVVPLVGRTDQVLPLLASESFDLIFIDGDHSYEAVRSDLLRSLGLLRPGGVLVLHDYDRESRLGPEYSQGELELGVTRAVDELGLEKRVVDTLAIMQPRLPRSTTSSTAEAVVALTGS